MRLSVDNVAFCTMVCNEAYWIYYTLRDAYNVFKHVVVLDTGSSDGTLEIIKNEFPNLTLIEENYGGDAAKIGNGRNVLREVCPTDYMFLADGDEIWREDKLRNVINRNIDDGVEVVMLAGWNVQDVNGKLLLRTNDLANRDGIFSRGVRWTALNYPFEGYGLVENYIQKGKGQYFPARECYAWHMRHTLRSPHDERTYFRKDKIGFYPYNGPFEEMPDCWLGNINTQWPNPYL